MKTLIVSLVKPSKSLPAVGSFQSNLSPVLHVRGGGGWGVKSLFGGQGVASHHRERLGVALPNPMWSIEGLVQVPGHRERLENCLLFQPAGNYRQIHQDKQTKNKQKKIHRA